MRHYGSIVKTGLGRKWFKKMGVKEKSGVCVSESVGPATVNDSNDDSL